jgi:hypothetical protein
MPAPNGAGAEEPVVGEEPDVVEEPVWRAWFKGNAYSLAAGEPGSIWTPGSRPETACAEAAEQLMASTARALTIDTPRARTAPKSSDMGYRSVAVGSAASFSNVEFRGLSWWARA